MWRGREQKEVGLFEEWKMSMELKERWRAEEDDTVGVFALISNTVNMKLLVFYAVIQDFLFPDGGQLNFLRVNPKWKWGKHRKQVFLQIILQIISI